MLAKLDKLNKSKDIEEVIKTGKTLNCSFCRIKFKKNGLLEGRFTIIMKSSVFPKAVQRNKIRRKYKEILKGVQEQIRNKDIVCFPFKTREKMKYVQLKEDLKICLTPQKKQ